MMDIQAALKPTGAAKTRGTGSMYVVVKKDAGVLYWVRKRSNKALHSVNSRFVLKADWRPYSAYTGDTKIIWGAVEPMRELKP